MQLKRLLAAFACAFMLLASNGFRVSAEELTSPAGEKIRDVYVIPDALGSRAALLNESGDVIWRQGYGLYGERLTDPNNSSDAADRFLDYTGHQVDSSGLVYMGARYYDPEIGRFLSMDPAGFDLGNVQSFNRYAYANNNPYRFVDPDGHAPFVVSLLIFVGTEVAGEAFEEATGVPAPTFKTQVSWRSSRLQRERESLALVHLVRKLDGKHCARRKREPVFRGHNSHLRTGK